MATTINKPVEKLLDAFRSLQGLTKNDKQGNSALINTLKEMESSYVNKVAESMPDYDSFLPKTTGAIPKTYQEKSDDELYKIAEDSIMEGISGKINKLNETTEKKIADLTKKLEKGELEFEADAQKADTRYMGAAAELLNKAARKGIAYSSIYDNIQDDILSGYKSELGNVKKEYEQLSTEIEREISLLNLSKENALLEYDLERASGIEKQLNKLKSDQQSAISTVNKYNKQIADAEIKFQTDRAKKIEKLQNDWRTAKEQQLKAEKTSGYTGDNLTEMNSRYELAKGFYFSVPKQSAKRLLEENADTLKGALGEIYYNKLYEENNNR